MKNQCARRTAPGRPHPQQRPHGRFALFFMLCSSFFLFLLSACHYARPDLDNPDMPARTRDSLACLYEHHFTLDANLEVWADSVCLELLPLKHSYYTLRRGDRVVVAEFAVHPADSVDSVWVKLAHSQEVQGWLRKADVKRAFVPTDSLSQAIHVFSDTHASYFVVVFAVFVAVWLVRAFRRKQLKLVYFNDIDSLYPLALCLLMACCATLYASMQAFAPDTWEHFYYNPTLSLLGVPLVLSAFLCGLWLFVVVLLAALDVLFRQLSPFAAVSYLLGLASSCIFCYFFFILTTPIYVGYACLAVFGYLFARRLRHSLYSPRYRCGRCGGKLMRKGLCPHCGALNE